MCDSSPRARTARAIGPSSFCGLPTTTRCASRSVRTFASASTRCTRPLSGTSALEVVTIRPGTRATSSDGDHSRVSAPIGTTETAPGAAPRCSAISRLELPETVMMCSRRAATRRCIRVKAYQRRSDSRFSRPGAASSSTCRSTVIGWWIVVTSGKPCRARPSRP